MALQNLDLGGHEVLAGLIQCILRQRAQYLAPTQCPGGLQIWTGIGRPLAGSVERKATHQSTQCKSVDPDGTGYIPGVFHHTEKYQYELIPFQGEIPPKQAYSELPLSAVVTNRPLPDLHPDKGHI